MTRVVIIQRALLHYRVGFFDQLRTRVAALGIELELVVGDESSWNNIADGSANLPWATRIHNLQIPIGRRQLVWQPALSHVRGADLVIVEQASRLLFNYPLFLGRHLRGPRVAFWGHGVNRNEALASPIGERIKRWMTPKPDWWFCYTEGTARLVEVTGFPPERMTVVQNAIDTSELQQLKENVSHAQRESTRRELGLEGGLTALSLGSIYPAKGPRFLLEVADALHDERPDFGLIVIGEGPDRYLFDIASVTRPWLHVLGMKTKKELARYSAVCDVILNPGLVGLGVLDSFALELPLFTMDLPFHSPEIEYLESGINGIVVTGEPDAGRFAREVLATVEDQQLLVDLRRCGHDSATRYSLEHMLDRFVSGISGCIAGR